MLISIAPLYQNQSGDVVKELLLVIYADFLGTSVAKISEALRNFKGPKLFQIDGLKLCPAKYYFNQSKTDLRQRLQRSRLNPHTHSLICVLFC